MGMGLAPRRVWGRERCAADCGTRSSGAGHRSRRQTTMTLRNKLTGGAACAVLAAAALVGPSQPGLAASAHGVSAGQPFPTDLLTTPDSRQLTGLRVDLPLPDCAEQPSSCGDVAVLN